MLKNREYLKVIFFVFVSLLVGCGPEKSNQEEKPLYPDRPSQFCPEESGDRRTWDAQFGMNPRDWAKEMNVVEIQEIPESLLIQMNREVNKVPKKLYSEFLAKNTSIDLVYGEGIVEHPLWKELGFDTAFSPELVVKYRKAIGTIVADSDDHIHAIVTANRHYDSRSANTILHEYGHVLESQFTKEDFMWRDLFHRSNLEEDNLIRDFTDNYGDSEAERFAEAFAMYFACGLSKKWMQERAPIMSKYFRQIEENGFHFDPELF